MRIAVTGRSGQVVTALLERGPSAGATILAVGRPELDLANCAPCHELFASLKPDVIVSAAAYTAVDKAESEPEVAHATNAQGPARVAAAATHLGVPLIHISTDYVFDGSKREPWNESDAPRPVSVYGASKLGGETAVLSGSADSTVVRVGWIYSPFGSNFVKTMLRLAETRDELRVVGDQVGAPTSALDVADGILAVARNLLERRGEAQMRGLFHMGAAGEATWADFAEAIFTSAARRGRNPITVRRIASEDYQVAAQRPKYSRLDSRKLASLHGVALPHWKTSLEGVLDRLI